MFRGIWAACLIITHCTLSVSSSHTHGARQLQPNPNPRVTPISISDINSNGQGSRFFNVSNLPQPTIIVRQNTTILANLVKRTLLSVNFRTIQGAVNSLKDRTGPQVIYIHDGVYREQVYVDYDPPLMIRGRTPNDSGQNFVSIVFALGAKEAKSNEASATLNVLKNDFGLYFVNVTNEYGTGTDTQALAMNAKGDRQGFYSCAVDFIFGRDSNAWFERLAIPVQKGTKEPITASGRHLNDTAGFYVFNNATVYSAATLVILFTLMAGSHGLRTTHERKVSNSKNMPTLVQAPKETIIRYSPNFPHLPENILGPDYLNWVDYTYRPILNSPNPIAPFNTLVIKKNRPLLLPTVPAPEEK
ncbi:hypothetical protein H4Q26_004919 [Puccinia striiformis f. sp. tritici PST-130]|nr:hypothetical protein H4Q26_004919 [Puccinia striiformis f. sp. tritici PST-130]